MSNNIKYLIIAIFICACPKMQAQINLVKNGGFEQKYTCPYVVDQIKAAMYWSCIDTGYISPLDTLAGNSNCSPEYINTCSSFSDVSAPYNNRFYQYPRTKNGMANVGMYTDDTHPTNYRRDYVMGRLSATLTAGKSYCVTFFVVLSDNPIYGAYAIDHIGAYMDNGSIDTNSECGWVHTQYTPQVYTTNIISDTLSWVKIQGSFIANGTEKYITLGNFFDTAHTNKVHLSSSVGSMYELDDVSLIASDAHAYAGADRMISLGDSTYVGVTDSNGDGMPCYWYVAGNASPIDSGGTIKVRPTVTTDYVVVMDLCGTVTRDTVRVRVHTAGVAAAGRLEDAAIWPNPAHDALNITNANGSGLMLYDMVGHQVLHATLRSDSEIINIYGLPRGIYVVQLTDADGYKVNRRVVKE